MLWEVTSHKIYTVSETQQQIHSEVFIEAQVRLALLHLHCITEDLLTNTHDLMRSSTFEKSE